MNNIQQTAITTDPEQRAIQLTFCADHLKLASYSSLGEASTTLPISGPPNPLTITLDPLQLKEFLTKMQHEPHHVCHLQKHKKRQAHNNSPLHENIPIPLSVQTTRHNPSDPQEYHQLILQIAKLCLTEAEFATIAHYKKLTQTQIAKKLNLAQTTISGLQRSAIRKLKHALLKGESHE